MIVAGYHPVLSILEARPRSIEYILVSRGGHDERRTELEALARELGIQVRLVERRELDRLAGKAHNGVAARVASREFDPPDACLGGVRGQRLALFLDQVTDPGNVGAILRTAASAGASVVVTERHSAGLNEAVSKASAGALERVVVGRAGNAARFLKDAKEAGFWVWGADPEGQSLWEADLSGDVLICLGAEGEGLRRLTRETCDGLVSIPMRATAGSLNVSVAAGILVYEVLRRRGGPPGESPA